MEASVLICTYNPEARRLARVIAGLATQTLPSHRWEAILVDNASTTPLALPAEAGFPLRIVRETCLGLTAARRRACTEASAPLVVFVDDDNVLAPDYLHHVLRLFGAHPRLGAMGGKILPEFESPPAPWQQEFFPLLALRDPGDRAVVAPGFLSPEAGQKSYPADAAPIGAGMALRVAAAQAWLDRPAALADRHGRDLSSAGDNDLVFSVMESGWDVAYFPELTLTHLIPASRLEPDYLARLNRGIQRSWMQVLARHAANPWPAVAPWTLPLRQAKAWITHRGWRKPAGRIRWQGACGHFEGRVESR